MNKKILGFILAVLFAAPISLKADEGMWLPMFVKRLNEVDMHAAGLQLTAEELYSINNLGLERMPLLVLVVFVLEKLFLQKACF